jgi:hypothetical protein
MVLPQNLACPGTSVAGRAGVVETETAALRSLGTLAFTLKSRTFI